MSRFNSDGDWGVPLTFDKHELRAPSAPRMSFQRKPSILIPLRMLSVFHAVVLKKKADLTYALT